MDMIRHPRRLRVAPQRIKPEIHQIELVSELDVIDNLYVLIVLFFLCLLRREEESVQTAQGLVIAALTQGIS